MNNWIGLLIALSLAIVAGVLNWKYLERKTTEIEMVSFLAVGDNDRVDAGDLFQERNFVSLDIPRKNASYLSDAAVFFKDRATVVGRPALRNYRSGDIVLWHELKTPPAELNLKDGEALMWVPVGGSFVPSLITPGDIVSFIVPKPGKIVRRGEVPIEMTQSTIQNEDKWNLEGEDSKNDLVMMTAGTEEIGPFRVVSVGGRLGSDRVARLSGGDSPTQQNTLGIALKRKSRNSKEFEQIAVDIRDRVFSSGFRHAGVVLHPPESAKEAKPITFNNN
jgi:hypothetical protein